MLVMILKVWMMMVLLVTWSGQDAREWGGRIGGDLDGHDTHGREHDREEKCPTRHGADVREGSIQHC
jgi:hypothetical protein